MDYYVKILSYTLFVIVAIISEVFCMNSTFHDGRNHFYSQHNGSWSNSNLLSNINPRLSAAQPYEHGTSFLLNNQSSWSGPAFDVKQSPQNRSVQWNPYGSRNNNQNPSPNNKITVNDDDLRSFSEELLERDNNNAAKFVTINYQGKTTSGSNQDQAPEPLLQVSNNVNGIAIMSKLKRLYNNYIVAIDQSEVVTSQEKEEEDDFIDAVIDTNVMEYTRTFLVSNGVISNDPKEFKDVLKEIWFTLYPRKKGKLGSSGFEHIFLGETKNNEVSGFHNWIYFNNQELSNTVNYLGYLKIVELGKKGAILKHHFKFHGVDKPVGSMFIGTSPEIEMALYTTCFLVRPDKVCPLQLAGKRFIIRAYTFTYQGKKLIGSAFPEI